MGAVRIWEISGQGDGRMEKGLPGGRLRGYVYKSVQLTYVDSESDGGVCFLGKLKWSSLLVKSLCPVVYADVLVRFSACHLWLCCCGS